MAAAAAAACSAALPPPPGAAGHVPSAERGELLLHCGSPSAALAVDAAEVEELGRCADPLLGAHGVGLDLYC